MRPRLILQAMPAGWQRKLVALLRELDEAFDWEPESLELHVVMKVGRGKYRRPPWELCDYRHGSVEHFRREAASDKEG